MSRFPVLAAIPAMICSLALGCLQATAEESAEKGGSSPPTAPEGPSPELMAKTQAIIRSVANERPKPTVPHLAGGSLETGAIIGKLVAEEAERHALDHQDALLLFDQAKAKAQQGQTAAALKLAREARTLWSDHVGIREFVATLQRQASSDHEGSAEDRARAHLSAAVVRARELLQRGETKRADDLLTGIAHAALLFPSDETIDEVRRWATARSRQLSAVSDRSDPKTDPKKPQKLPVPSEISSILTKTEQLQDVPAYLQSGQSLVKDIQRLLR
ncbi:hypothetical protein [Planctomycetes bacterium Pan216]